MHSDKLSISREAELQMTEETRKQWISGHVSRGKAYESLAQAFRWLVAKRKEAKILNRHPWVEPFAADRPGFITAAEAITLLLRIIKLNRNYKDFSLEISESEIKHELRGDVRELLLEFDRLFERRELFRKHERNKGAGPMDFESHIQDSDLKSHTMRLDERLQQFDEEYRHRVENMLEHSCFPASPYLEGEVLLRANFTGTAASLMKMLVEVVRWNEYESGEKDVLVLIEQSIERCWDWLVENKRAVSGGGVGWGWTGFIQGGGSTKKREEVAAIYSLDADRCMPQTYFTAQVISSLTHLYWVLADPDPNRPVYRAQITIQPENVKRLLEQAVEGLIKMNRVGDGWIDVEPYLPTPGRGTTDAMIKPARYTLGLPTPSLLHTAYAVSALAELPLLTRGEYRLNDHTLKILERAIVNVISALDKPTLSFLRDNPSNHVLSRMTNGQDLLLQDECGIYVIFKAIAMYSMLSDPRNPVPGHEGIRQLTEEATKPYYALAQYILDEIREPMHDKRGFPATGELGKNEIDRFPAVRATNTAISAFQYFGLKQMVPGICKILEYHLNEAKERVILELVNKYGELERQGIRVAWGLIESDGEQVLHRRQASQEAAAAMAEDRSLPFDPDAPDTIAQSMEAPPDTPQTREGNQQADTEA